MASAVASHSPVPDDCVKLLDMFLHQLEPKMKAAIAMANSGPDPAASVGHPPLATPAGGIDELRAELMRVVAFLLSSERGLLEHTTEVLDTCRIVQCVGRNSGRRFWLVESSGKRNAYVCLGGHYCSCRSFLELSKRSSGVLLCKHLLAIRLAPYLSNVIEEFVEDDQLHRILNRQHTS